MKRKPFPPDSIRLLLVGVLHGGEICKNYTQEEVMDANPDSGLNVEAQH